MKTQAEIEKIKNSVDVELSDCSEKIKYALRGWEEYSLSLLFEEKTKLTISDIDKGFAMFLENDEVKKRKNENEIEKILQYSMFT